MRGPPDGGPRRISVMPIELPNLDDRTYADLMDEARAFIPTAAPEWTNHNPSDPGVTVLEVFAHLSEMLIYRLNRVTEANVRVFLALLNGPQWEGRAGQNLPEQVRETVLTLRRPYRAVTCTDFERLALDVSSPGGGRVGRAHCVPGRNLEVARSAKGRPEKPGHVSVVIVPQIEESSPQPDEELLRHVSEELERRRLLTTYVHVVGPRYVEVRVQITLTLKPDVLEAVVRREAVEGLRRYFHPLRGGADGRGWPFGRNVYVSEIYELLDKIPGVDYVTKSVSETGQMLDELRVDDATRLRYVAAEPPPAQELVSVQLESDELVHAVIEDDDVVIRSPLTT